MSQGMTLSELHEQIVPVKGEPIWDHLQMLVYQSNAMAGEAGEVANVVKKLARDGIEHRSVGDLMLISECGDILFYMSRLLRLRGFSLESAAVSLLEKLEQQKKELNQ